MENQIVKVRFQLSLLCLAQHRNKMFRILHSQTVITEIPKGDDKLFYSSPPNIYSTVHNLSSLL